MREDKAEIWNQVPLEFLDLTDEKLGDWTIGLEFTREGGVAHPRVRSFARNEETGAFYTLEAAHSVDGKPIASDAAFFEKVPEEVAMLVDNLSVSADLGVMLGLGRERDILRAQQEEEANATHSEPRFALEEAETQEPADEWPETLNGKLQQAWQQTVDSHSQEADGLLERLIAYQQASVRDIARKKDYVAAADDLTAERMQPATMKGQASAQGGSAGLPA